MQLGCSPLQNFVHSGHTARAQHAVHPHTVMSYYAPQSWQNYANFCSTPPLPKSAKKFQQLEELHVRHMPAQLFYSH